MNEWLGLFMKLVWWGSLCFISGALARKVMQVGKGQSEAGEEENGKVGMGRDEKR